MKNEDIKATIANLTFTVGQLEEIKSNINDTLRYIKQNTEWHAEDSKNESAEDAKEIKA